jgi:hypothetical protein
MGKSQVNWLSKEELIFHRMEKFHRERVDNLANGKAPLSKHVNGTLVVHLIPQACVISRNQFEGAKLKEHGRATRPLGGGGANSRFNVDGLLSYDGQREIMAYTQVFRDGRVEAAMTDIGYKENGFCAIRDMICEQAVFSLVGSYLQFCEAIGLETPITMLSALIDCVGIRFKMHPRFPDFSDNAIDRSPAFLPELKLPKLDIKPANFLRPWCDTFWQAGGLECSLNYDGDGNWHQRR